MKNIILSIAFVSIVVAAVVTISLSGSPVPCSQPLTYRIGTIDPRFDIDKQDLRNLMKDVAKLWSTALDKPMLVFNDSASIAIHLIYSDQQRQTKAEQKLSGKIAVKKRRFDLLKQRYESQAQDYKKRENDLKALHADYQQKVQKLNQGFSEMKSGGISEHEERSINQKKRELDNLKYRIDQLLNEMTSLRNRITQKAEKLNAISSKTGEMIAAYNERFANVRKFDQGRYVKRGDLEMIKIFQFDNRYELKLVLAHEIGHAMGLGHVPNPKSIMFYLIKKQDIYDLSLSEQDLKALESLCD